ncbi:Thymus-specific serine protease [Perkinsus chesapeaki]|uniref:Thymus-specific serine protease n=1 Tax=Perkinsus chesapeaki TaxID=330153 RepID=A0A7J6LWN0_PERCH|nr:Thymus-specific serine protease [Perkinsus chesapeaki]
MSPSRCKGSEPGLMPKRLPTGYSESLGTNDSWKEKKFESFVDHSKGKGGKTFAQYYLENKQYYNPQRPMLFLGVNAMSPLPASPQVEEMADAAKAFGAWMIILERRYIGKSLPTNEYSVATLTKFFTEQQTVEDVALFGEKMKNEIPGLKIILFGCSSGGTTAALARKYHPNIFDGAVVSSAVFKFKLEFQEYVEVIAEDLKNPRLEGSSECLTAITAAHAKIGEMFGSKEGRQQLETMFGLVSGDLDDPAVRTDFSYLGQLLGINLQYNDPQCKDDYCNIEKICKRFAEGTESPLIKLINVYATNMDYPYGESLATSLRELVNLLKNEKSAGKQRMLHFRICSGRALFMPCVSGSCPFFTGKEYDWVEFGLWLCREGLGIKKEDVQRMGVFWQENILKGIADFQAYVGDFRGVTHVLSINGDADPWYPASITQGGHGPDVEMLPDATLFVAPLATDRGSCVRVWGMGREMQIMAR